MNLEQLTDRLIANGQNMKLMVSSSRTDDGYNSLEVFSEIEKTDAFWMVSKTAYNKKEVMRAFLDEDVACLFFFLKVLRSQFSKTIDQMRLNLSLSITNLKTKDDAVSFLSKIGCQNRYFSFDENNFCKDSFYIRWEADSCFTMFYTDDKGERSLISNKWTFAYFEILYLQLLRNEEQILIENGIIKVPFSRMEILVFIKGDFDNL